MKRSGRSLVLFLVGALIIGPLLRAWALMIALGMIAGWSGLVGLAVGFWPAFALGTLLQLAFGKFKVSAEMS